MPRGQDGQIIDRVDPYAIEDGVVLANVRENQSGLQPGWTKISLDKCQIRQSNGDKKCFKLFVNRQEENKFHQHCTGAA